MKTALRIEGITYPSLVSILLVENEEIRSINKEHRDKDSVTDVISFPMLAMKEGLWIEEPGELDMEEGKLFLGDIVIAVPKAVEQAELYGHAVEREVAFLAIHGFLHLLGYDHDKPQCEEKMLYRQEQVLSEMGLFRK